MAATTRSVTTFAAVLVIISTILLLFTTTSTSAQSTSPSSQCTSVLVSLSPCLNYISGNESSVPSSCCTQLSKVVQSNPQCLCVALNADPASLGLTVNRTRALGLPNACNVKTPDVSNCKGGVGAPASSPESGTTTAGGGGAGSKTTPATTTTGSVAGGAAGLRLGYGGLKVAGVVAVAVLAGVAV